MPTILIVEDEPDLGKLLADYIEASSFTAVVIQDGLEAKTWLSTEHADLIVLDLMLPSLDGMSLCKHIRTNDTTPIIMATAKVEEIDRLLGLEIGADDYICKPYSPREVVARIKAILRRCQPDDANGNKLLQSINLDPHKHLISIHGNAVNITSIELKLFELLYNEPGRIFTREYIMDNIYNDYRIVSDRTVDSHIKKLRKKLHDAAPNMNLIHSIYGAGYKFELQDA